MRKIKDVLRLKLDAQHSRERIAAPLGISKVVVTKYVTLAGAAKLDWPTIQGLDEADLQRRLLPAPVKHSDVVLPDYGYILQELCRKGMALMLLWEEHCGKRPRSLRARYQRDGCRLCPSLQPLDLASSSLLPTRQRQGGVGFPNG